MCGVVVSRRLVEELFNLLRQHEPSRLNPATRARRECAPRFPLSVRPAEAAKPARASPSAPSPPSLESDWTPRSLLPSANARDDEWHAPRRNRRRAQAALTAPFQREFHWTQRRSRRGRPARSTAV